MANILITSTLEDHDTAQSIATALEAEDYSVCWNRELLSDETIERELAFADWVIVLWSGHSASSKWVQREAAAAAERGALVSVLIAEVELPRPFQLMNTIDLTAWNGDPSAPEFYAVRRTIAEIEPGSIGPIRPPLSSSPEPLLVRYAAVLATALALPVIIVNIFLGILDKPAAAIPLSLAAFLLSIACVLAYVGFARERFETGFYVSSTATSMHYPVFYRYSRRARLLSLAGSFISLLLAISLVIKAPIAQDPTAGAGQNRSAPISLPAGSTPNISVAPDDGHHR